MAVALLDDPCPAVRRALAEALAPAREAPRAIVVALANDETSAAEPVLLRSPLLTDGELAERMARGDEAAQCAIARRAGLGPLTAGALADKAPREAILIALGGADEPFPVAALKRVHGRFAGDAEMCAALLARGDLPATLRADMMLANLEGGRTDRAARDAALVRIAAQCDDGERIDLVRLLRDRATLTLSLLLRSVLSGDRALLAASLSELSGMTLRRAAAFTRAPAGEGFAALGIRAGLSPRAVTALREALCALEARGDGAVAGLRADLVSDTIAACEKRRNPALGSIVALLWRFAAEAARREAREAVGSAFATRPRLPPALDFPAANDSSALELRGRLEGPADGAAAA
jgi:uncharacterized protein (DUF2336 family)